MENKHTGKIIGLLVLMFITSFGSTTEELTRMGYDFDVVSGYGFLLTLANLALVSAVMMLVPFICRLIRKAKLPNKSGKRLCMWNSIIMFIISTVLLAVAETNFIGGIGAIIFYFINKWIFVSEHSFPTIANAPTTPASPSQQTRVCISDENQEHKEYGSWNVYGSDIRLEKHTEDVKPIQQMSAPHQYRTSTTTPVAQKNSSKKAVGLGAYIIISILSIALVAACAACVILCSSINDLEQDVAELQQEVEELEEENQQYYDYYVESFHEIAFYDEFVVFVENDGTKLYHNYKCNRFKGDDFWAYNIDAALDHGYLPCPLCCN